MPSVSGSGIDSFAPGSFAVCLKRLLVGFVVVVVVVYSFRLSGAFLEVYRSEKKEGKPRILVFFVKKTHTENPKKQQKTTTKTTKNIPHTHTKTNKI